MQLYQELPTIECLAGDTLPTFTVQVETSDESPDLSGCTMYLIIARRGDEMNPVVTRTCAQNGGVFTARVTSSDTAGMSGMYSLHFELHAENALVYKKLYGLMHVRAAATVLGS